MVLREKELNIICKYTTYSFWAMYGIGLSVSIIRKRSWPYFRDWIKHGFLGICGGLGTGMLSEKVAAEVYYNKILIQLADKYNFTPQEVTELQRNLNEYYLDKERQQDLTSAD